MIVKYCPPTKFESAKYATICEVITEYNQDDKNDKSDFYIQINPNEETPKWMRMGTFLEEAFKQHFDDPAFISMCLRMFEGNLISYDTLKKVCQTKSV